MKTLTTFKLDSIDHLVQPEEFVETTVHSPARQIFTDFKITQPFVIEAETKATDAELEMRRAHVKLKLVVDRSMELVGVASFQDVAEQEIIKKVGEGFTRDDIRVAELMRPRAGLQALDIAEVDKATVGDVLHTLQTNGEQHCLVIDRERHHIRGLISASDIARRLHIPVVIEKAPSFADVFRVLKAT